MSLSLPTPAFVLDYAALDRNLAILAQVKARTGCHILLALKAFSMFAAFERMRATLDGCCASSVHEAQLARDAFGGEVHGFAAAFSTTEMHAMTHLCDYLTLNSAAQLQLLRDTLAHHPPPRPIRYGLRINPEHSEGATPIYDPCAPLSRLGVRRATLTRSSLTGCSGLHSHTLCEQNAAPFVRTLQAIERNFGEFLPQLAWFNFGGGHHLTRADYDLDLMCATLNDFQRRYPNIQRIYLEPGEACVLDAGTLVTSVLDMVENEMPIAIMDASCSCHMPDVMEMPYRPRVFRDANWRGEATPGPQADRGAAPGVKPYTVRLAGATCLAGDIIGDWSFTTPLKIGDRLIFEDMAHYTMVKTNTFNGINLPTIATRDAQGALQVVRTFGYDDFKARLS